MGHTLVAALKGPLHVLNAADIQGARRCTSGRVVFLGLVPGLRPRMILHGRVGPLQLGHHAYKKGTYEDDVGDRGLQQRGKKKWRKHVGDVVERLVSALQPDDVLLVGGNVKHLNQLLPGCRVGDNANAFKGGFRMWEDAPRPASSIVLS